MQSPGWPKSIARITLSNAPTNVDPTYVYTASTVRVQPILGAE